MRVRTTSGPPTSSPRRSGTRTAAWAAEVFRVTPDGTFESGASTLQLLVDPDDPARLASVRERLRQARAERARPARDDKVVAAWNGWLVDSLVSAAMVFDRPGLAGGRGRGRRGGLAAALAGRPAAAGVPRRPTGERAGDRRGLRRSGPGRRPAGGRNRGPGLAGPRPGAGRGAAGAVRRRGSGVLRHRGRCRDALHPAQDPTDNATPSGLSATVHALRLLAELTGESGYADRADRAAASVGGLAAAGSAVRRLAAGGRDQRPARAHRRCRSPIVGSGRRGPRRAGPRRLAEGAGRVGGAGRGAGPARVRAAGRPAGARRPGDGVRLPGFRLPAAGDLGRGARGPAAGS